MMNKPSLFKRIVFRYQISKYLKPFMCLDNSFDNFEIVQTTPSVKLLELIKNLREYVELYSSELSKFDKLEKEIVEHNNEVRRLKLYNFKRDVNEFYKNPSAFKITDFDDDYYSSKLIKKYIGVDDYLNYQADEIIKLVDNYSLINNEFLLHKKYDELILFKDVFYDFRKKDELKNKLDAIQLELKDKELFYKFPLFDDNNFENAICKHNDEYVKCHLNDAIFDNINNKSLDIEQRTSILKDEISNLTIAGAGSGKTLTICGKLKFLLSNGVNPQDILLLSYSKKSTDDLEKKAKNINSNLTVGTFHKIGLEILEKNLGKKFMVEDQFNAIIENYFTEEIKNDSEALKAILRFYSLFINSNDKKVKYDSKGDLYKDLKSADYKTLRDIVSNISDGRNRKITLKKEIVKSIEELEIANFYFLNGIDYVYERPYEYEVSDNLHRQYTPDFYLKDYGIYHEHYGVNKDGKAVQYENEEAKKYEDGIVWKRYIHKKYHTKCLETFSYEFSDGTIYDNLTFLLKQNGIKFNPLSVEKVKEVINSIYYEKSFKSLINLIKSFISLYKAKYKDATYFDEIKKSSFKNKYQEIRASLFIDICKKIYCYYIEYLNKENKIDFDDMILKSKDAIEESDEFKYKYIIVDEFQDISFSRMEFLKSLISHGNSKLFAVGDDWQAIYRFSGCDLSLFLNFKNYFKKSEISYITSTHRNSQELQDIAGPFIKKNKQQMNKTIKSIKHLDKPIKLVYFNGQKYKAFEQILSLINEKNPNANILILGRNNRDIEDILNDKLRIINSFGIKRNSVLHSKEFPKLKLTYSTVHASKGLEEDYTIIINADDKIMGFPNKMEDDPLLNLVLSEEDQMEYAEERRLWYVALTRTRTYCYIIVDSMYPSSFVEEIKEKCEIINRDCLQEIEKPLMCPKCGSGRLIIRKDKTGKEFYGCSNYPYCDYTIGQLEDVKRNARCPICKDFMIRYKSVYGTYYVCHNKFCKHKINGKGKQKQN